MSFRNFKCNFLPLFCKQLFTAHRSSTLRLNTSLKISSLQKTYIHSAKVQFTNFSFLYALFLRLRIHGAIKRRAFVNSKSHKDVPARSFSSIWPQTMTLLTPHPQRPGTAAETNAPPKRSPTHNRSPSIYKVGWGPRYTLWVRALKAKAADTGLTMPKLRASIPMVSLWRENSALHYRWGKKSFLGHRSKIFYLADMQPNSQSPNGTWNISRMGGWQSGEHCNLREHLHELLNAEITEVLSKPG